MLLASPSSFEVNLNFTHVRSMRGVMVLGQSTQHNFPFKAHLSNHLLHVCVWV